MKFIRSLSLCLVAQFALLGGAMAEEAVSAYQQAVNAYVEAAGNELQALQGQADAGSKAAVGEKQAAYQEVLAKLEKCELTYKELKAAAPKDFDKTKARYESQRLEVVKALAEIQG